MYQKSAQKLSTDECYPDSVIEEFKNFIASLDDLMPYYKLILSIVNSFSGDIEKFYPKIYSLQIYSQAENYKNLRCPEIINRWMLPRQCNRRV